MLWQVANPGFYTGDNQPCDDGPMHAHWRRRITLRNSSVTHGLSLRFRDFGSDPIVTGLRCRQ